MDKKLYSVLGCACALMAAFAPSVEAKTKIQLWFDTEDYTVDRANDAIRDLANILTSEGLRGHFNVVGYLGKRIVDLRRFDVIDALKPHLVGTQTLYHSLHPNVVECSDFEDYDAAFRRVSMDEALGLGMLKAAFGREKIIFSCFPGDGSSSLALEAYSDMGITFHGGMGYTNEDPELVRRGQVWYCNIRHLLYNSGKFYLESFLNDYNCTPEKEKAALDAWSKRELVLTYMHPNMALYSKFWDAVNYNRGNQGEWGKWNVAPERSPAETAVFYERLRAFLRRLKADPRFEITDCEKMLAEQKARVTITAKDIPEIRRQLSEELHCITTPASWSVADCFQAAVRILRGEKSHTPDKVYGFLEAPKGVTSPTKIKVADLKEAAKSISFTRHLPASYRVGDVVIGPADFLFAALEAIETGAEEVVVKPRNQLGDIAKRYPHMANFKQKGHWLYTPEFEDRYVSDRLRWQYWTMRFE